MKSMFRFLLLGALLALGVACDKKADKGAAAPAPVVKVSVPTTDDAAAWKAYLTQVVRDNKGKYRRPYIYWIPSGDDPESQRQQADQLDNLGNAVGRGIQSGSMVAFGALNSAKMADMVIEAFKLAAPKSLKGVRVVFVGAPADEQRVRDAVAPTEGDFVFVAMQ